MKVVQHPKLHRVEEIWLRKLRYSAGNVSKGIEALVHMDICEYIRALLRVLLIQDPIFRVIAVA